MKKLFYVLLAGVLTFSAVFMSGCAAKSEEAATPANKTPETHNLVITPEENTTIKLFAATQEVAGTKETVQTLTAVVEPNYATDQRVDWSFSWKNGASDWANEKDLDDYIKTTVAEDGAAMVTIECLQPFGEPIIANVITRDSRDKEKYISAHAQIDYAKRIKSCELSINDYVIGSDVENYMITARSEDKLLSQLTTTPTFGIGTIEDEFTYNYYIQYHEETYGDVANAILNEISSSTMSLNSGAFEKSEFNPVSNFGGLDRTFGFNAYLFPMSYTNPEEYADYIADYRAEILAAYRSCVGQVIATITIEATGKYSSYTREIGIGYCADALVVETESVSISESVVF